MMRMSLEREVSRMAKFKPWLFLPEYQGKTKDYIVYSIPVPKLIEIIIVAWWKVTGGKKKAHEFDETIS